MLSSEELRGKYDRGEDVFPNQGGGQQQHGGFHGFHHGHPFGGGGQQYHFKVSIFN